MVAVHSGSSHLGSNLDASFNLLRNKARAIYTKLCSETERYFADRGLDSNLIGDLKRVLEKISYRTSVIPRSDDIALNRIIARLDDKRDDIALSGDAAEEIDTILHNLILLKQEIRAMDVDISREQKLLMRKDFDRAIACQLSDHYQFN